jgi:hypothetical protein
MPGEFLYCNEDIQIEWPKMLLSVGDICVAKLESIQDGRKAVIIADVFYRKREVILWRDSFIRISTILNKEEYARLSKWFGKNLQEDKQ